MWTVTYSQLTWLPIRILYFNSTYFAMISSFSSLQSLRSEQTWNYSLTADPQTIVGIEAIFGADSSQFAAEQENLLNQRAERQIDIPARRQHRSVITFGRTGPFASTESCLRKGDDDHERIQLQRKHRKKHTSRDSTKQDDWVGGERALYDANLRTACSGVL